MSEIVSKPAVTTIPLTHDMAETSSSIEVVLSFRVDLRLLRRQKRALIDIRRNSKVSADQEDAVEGILSMIDFIQDSIVDQGLADEKDVFPQMPLPFETAA
jgi:hypothetical protein